MLVPVAEDEGMEERGGLLVATGRLVGDAADHREVRESRLRGLAGKS